MKLTKKRRLILTYLQSGSASTSEIAGAFGLCRQTVREFIKELESAGVVANANPEGWPRWRLTGKPVTSSLSPRQQALATGETKYLGAPCAHGHLGVREAKSKICIECRSDRNDASRRRHEA